MSTPWRSPFIACTNAVLSTPVLQPLTLQHRCIGCAHRHHLWGLAQQHAVCGPDPVPDALLQVGGVAEASHQQHLQGQRSQCAVTCSGCCS